MPRLPTYPHLSTTYVGRYWVQCNMFARTLVVIGVVVPLVSLVYRGEAGLLLVTPKYGYFRNVLPLVSVVGLFSPLSSSSAFLRSLFTQSSHLSCSLPRILKPSFFRQFIVFHSDHVSSQFHSSLGYFANYASFSSNFFS